MSGNQLKIIFMGTPDFALTALEHIHQDSGHQVVAVYSQPPRPKGRGHKVQPSIVHAYAQAHDIAVYTPKTLKQPEAQKEFADIGADVAVVAAYGLLLPKSILNAPRYGCLNIHASLLPRWRGASPIQQAIWKGDTETGVTIMQMDEGLDTGAMIAKESIAITSETTASTLHDELAKLGAQMTLRVLDDMAAAGAKLPAEVQDNSQATYARLLSKDDGRIDWNQSAAQIDRQIRALNPWPGVWMMAGDTRIKVLKAQALASDVSQAAGTLLNRDGDVACGDGSVLSLTTIHPAGAGKPMDVQAALNGGYIALGGLLT